MEQEALKQIIEKQIKPAVYSGMIIGGAFGFIAGVAATIIILF